METAQALIKELYTSFLLRDFAGKIVPGLFFILSIVAIFSTPRQVARHLFRKYPATLLVFLAGFAWTVMLGLQGLSAYFEVWNYYPKVDKLGKPLAEMGTGGAQDKVQEFLRVACSRDRLQYERYVVIKEATGNLFFAMCLSMPGWVVFFYRVLTTAEKNKSAPDPVSSGAKISVFVLVTGILLFGLYQMNKDHVKRQLSFVEATLEHKDTIRCPAEEREKTK